MSLTVVSSPGEKYLLSNQGNEELSICKIPSSPTNQDAIRKIQAILKSRQLFWTYLWQDYTPRQGLKLVKSIASADTLQCANIPVKSIECADAFLYANIAAGSLLFQNSLSKEERKFLPQVVDNMRVHLEKIFLSDAAFKKSEFLFLSDSENGEELSFDGVKIIKSTLNQFILPKIQKIVQDLKGCYELHVDPSKIKLIISFQKDIKSDEK